MATGLIAASAEPLRGSTEPQARIETSSAAPALPDEPELADQIVQSLRLHATSGGGEARVQLRPEYLGELTIRLVVDDGVVTARVEAELPAVREWIERHEVSLRQALGEHGLTLDALNVSDGGQSEETLDRDAREHTPDQPSSGRQRRPRRHTGDDGPRFEVTA